MRITHDGPGEVLLDGVSLGRSRGVVERTVPVGTYRAWVVSDEGASLPRSIEVAEGATAEVHIDTALDRCLAIGSVVALTCADHWAAHLRAVARASGAARGVGVLGAGPRRTGDAWHDGALVVDPTQPDAPPPGSDVAADLPAGAIPRFSPLYLIPFGGVQLAQDRPVFAGAYLAASLGSVTWLVIATVLHQDAVNGTNPGGEPDLRVQRNAAVGVSIAALVLPVAEALLVGQIAGE